MKKKDKFIQSSNHQTSNDNSQHDEKSMKIAACTLMTGVYTSFLAVTESRCVVRNFYMFSKDKLIQAQQSQLKRMEQRIAQNVLKCMPLEKVKLTLKKASYKSPILFRAAAFSWFVFGSCGYHFNKMLHLKDVGKHGFHKLDDASRIIYNKSALFCYDKKQKCILELKSPSKVSKETTEDIFNFSA